MIVIIRIVINVLSWIINLDYTPAQRRKTREHKANIASWDASIAAAKAEWSLTNQK